MKGLMGCLDCMHVYWRTCPVAWQGQFSGKEEQPSLVLEGVADYNCWFWHSFFGCAGTLNDINMWDRSPLLRSFLDGSFETVDFEFSVSDTVFKQLYFLVDGIYPELSIFVKTVSVPLNNLQQRYSKWQEGARKSVERAFGILQRKFQILQRPVEMFYQDDIKNMVEACIILHNMMVEHRIKNNQKEFEVLYDDRPLDERCEREALVNRRGISAASAASVNNNGTVREAQTTRAAAVSERWGTEAV